MDKKCEYCGELYQPNKITAKRQRFCSEPCQRAYWVDHPEERKQFTYTCKNCGEEYQTRYADRNQYCSRECAFEYKKANKKDKYCVVCGKSFSHQGKYCTNECMRSHNHVCVICHMPFTGTSQQVFCSEECVKEHNRREDLERNKRKHQSKIFICKECGEQHITEYGDKSDVFCSRKCQKKYNGRVGKAKRRARLFGNGEIETIDPYAVFSRDGWRCRLCGIKTPRQLRGSLDDRAPELDHLIPLALGGTHIWENVQCLCRKCNQNKGATIAGQLRFA